MKRISLCFIIILSIILNLSVVGNVFANQPKEESPKKHIKSLDEKGKIPAKWNLTKPKPKPHPDVPPPVPGNKDLEGINDPSIGILGGNGDGENDITFESFDSGDIIVGLGTPTGHAGEFDADRYSGELEDYCIWSANVEPVDGVQLEQPGKYREDYDEAYGLWVPSVSYPGRVAARDYCEDQLGEPYELNGYKNTTDEWYCSKLCWASYRWTAGVDLDADGGLYVWPVDLIDDSQTSEFAHGT
ncbi:MAG: hypothetical protein K6T65_08260 [Peptococcaceae bacterium]|nr:hypothetical protein [Peptococcaceae bacterium]